MQPIPFDSIKMLSIGTGVFPYHLDGDESWGLAQWAPHLVDLLTDGVNEVAEFQTAQMMDQDKFCRIRIRLQPDIRMDAASEIGTLQRIGNAADIVPAVGFCPGLVNPAGNFRLQVVPKPVLTQSMPIAPKPSDECSAGIILASHGTVPHRAAHAEAVREACRAFLEDKLRLTLHMEKTGG